MAQETRFRLDIIADQTSDVPVLGAVDDRIRIQHDAAIADADLRFLAEFSLSASASTNFDLSGGVEGPRGETLTFATVKTATIIHDDDSEASSVSLSGNLGTVLFSTTAIPPNGSVVRTGSTAVNTSQKVITVTNDDGAETATGKVIITGTSA